MLLELSIKNFAIIDDLKVSFTKGLNLLTGETGAGKSIIIEALGIILGGRGTKDLIRRNETKAVLQAVFFMEDVEKIEPILDEYGIDIDADKLLIITREISTSHPSISRINGRTVTLSILNKISSNLVDIFAQHEHQSLLDINNHKILVDSFGDRDFKELKFEIKSLYDEYIKEKRNLSQMNKRPEEREREIDLLKFQIQEIDSVKLNDSDDEELENEFNRISNIKDIEYGIGNIVESLSSSQYDQLSILSFINKNIKILNGLIRFDQELELPLNRLKELNFELQDLHNDLTNYLDGINIDDERLEFLTERLNEVNKLKKKYGNSVSDILIYREKINRELKILLNYEKEIELLNNKIQKYEEKLYALSKKLTSKRKNISKYLEEKITAELKQLNMENIIFEVYIEEKNDLSSDGIDYIEFLIATNPGENLHSLSKIVSGGEMSRIMLGFKSILAKHDGIPTMIFDEIDIGISGRTAQVVGEKISYISKEHQIISITHLPQIAALADSHYLISKKIIEGKTATTISRLTDEERIKEMARLLGGVDVTNTTLNHAREMIEMSQKVKNKNY